MQVALWTLFIYLTIPLARSLQRWVYEQLGRATFLYVVFAALLVGLAFAVRVVRRAPGSTPSSSWWWLAGVACAFAGGAWHLRANPEEAMHFVQYGVLSLLLFRAFREHMADSGLYVACFFAGAFLGVLDEFIQWLVPRRFFDFRDMFINISAVTLVQLALARGVRPAGPSTSFQPRSMRIALMLATALALFVMLILAATPARVAALTEALGVKPMDEAMVEYGHRLQAGGETHFVSRRSGPALLEEDARRHQELGPRLAQAAADRDYEAFLLAHPAWQDPFAHELRVHLFRRDRYWKEARAHRSDPEKHAEKITVAFREQQILETYFPKTLAASGLDWPPDLRERARLASRPGDYQSPVSRHLMVRFTHPQLQGLVLAAWLVFGGWVRYAVRRGSTES